MGNSCDERDMVGHQGTDASRAVSAASRGLQDGAFDFLRHLQRDKTGRGIEVILAALINNAEIASASGILVREYLIDFMAL
jgi:hypothetical protein